MSKVQKTISAIIEASKSPTLSEQGLSAYVELGHRCIVGEVLHSFGVSDDVMRYSGNNKRLDQNFNLRLLVGENNLDFITLQEAQDAFDSGKFDVAYYEEKLQGESNDR